MPEISAPAVSWPPNPGAGVHVEVDADLLVYSCGYAAAEEPLEYALRTCRECIRDIIRDSGADSWTAHLTHEDVEHNFRHGIATIQPYKGQRGSKPEYYKEIREYFVENYNGVIHDGIEADDAMSIAAYQDPSRIIASRDKDLKCVRGATIYNWGTKKIPAVWHQLTDVEAYRWFYTQCLTGDYVDNIKGLSLTRAESKYCGRSVGPASKWVQHLDELEEPISMYTWVLNAYEQRHEVLRSANEELSEPLKQMLKLGPEESLTENARLLHMLEFEGQLWEPPSASD